MPADQSPATVTNRKKPTMRNPFETPRQRPERYDETWHRRNDPVAHQAVQEVTRRGY